MGLKILPPVKRYIEYSVSLLDGDQGGGGKRTIRLNAKKQKSSSCDDGSSRKGLRVRDNETFVLYFDTRPFLTRQGTSIVALLEHDPQTDTTSEMARHKITLCLRSTA